MGLTQVKQDVSWYSQAINRTRQRDIIMTNVTGTITELIDIATELSARVEEGLTSFAIVQPLSVRLDSVVSDLQSGGFEGTEAHLFHWTREDGDCQDCGAPAAYITDGDRTLCGLCAAVAASEDADLTALHVEEQDDPFDGGRLGPWDAYQVTAEIQGKRVCSPIIETVDAALDTLGVFSAMTAAVQGGGSAWVSGRRAGVEYATGPRSRWAELSVDGPTGAEYFYDEMPND